MLVPPSIPRHLLLWRNLRKGCWRPGGIHRSGPPPADSCVKKNLRMGYLGLGIRLLNSWCLDLTLSFDLPLPQLRPLIWAGQCLDLA